MKCELYIDNTSEMRYNISHKDIILHNLHFVNRISKILSAIQEEKCAEYAANIYALRLVHHTRGQARRAEEP